MGVWIDLGLLERVEHQHALIIRLKERCEILERALTDLLLALDGRSARDRTLALTIARREVGLEEGLSPGGNEGSGPGWDED